jgi:hypothetical protein
MMKRLIALAACIAVGLTFAYLTPADAKWPTDPKFHLSLAAVFAGVAIYQRWRR